MTCMVLVFLLAASCLALDSALYEASRAPFMAPCMHAASLEGHAAAETVTPWVYCCVHDESLLASLKVQVSQGL